MSYNDSPRDSDRAPLLSVVGDNYTNNRSHSPTSTPGSSFGAPSGGLGRTRGSIPISQTNKTLSASTPALSDLMYPDVATQAEERRQTVSHPRSKVTSLWQFGVELYQRIGEDEDDHLVVEETHLASNGRTVLTLFKAFVASGILFLPNGFLAAGFAASLVTIVVAGLLTLYSMKLLLNAREATEALGITVWSYCDIGEAAYGTVGRTCVNAAIILSQLGFCCVYYAFISGNAKDLVLDFSNQTVEWPEWSFMLLCLPLFIPMVLIRHLKFFAIPCLVSNFLTLASLLVVYIYVVSHVATDGVADIAQFSPKTYVKFLGTALYAFEGVGVVIPCYNSMQNPKDLFKLLKGVICFVIFLMCTFGGLCYLCFGSVTKPLIFLNLPGDQWYVKMVQIMYIIAIIFTFPVMLFPATKIPEKFLFKLDRRSGKKWQKNLLRITITLACLGVSVLASDQLDNFVSIIGGVCCVPLVLVCPALFHAKLCGSTTNAPIRSPSRGWDYSDWGLAGLGVLCGIVATTVAALDWAGVDLA